MPPDRAALAAHFKLTAMQWQAPLERLVWALRRLHLHALPPPARLALLAARRLARQPRVKEWSERLRVLVVDLAAIYGLPVAATMANVDLGGQYKRIMRFFWDPEPTNDDSSPMWCLGREYASKPLSERQPSSHTTLLQEDADRDTVVVSSQKVDAPAAQQQQETASGVLVPSTSHENGTSEEEEDRGWPAEFLDDFESRFWFTYRSHFPAIEKSADPASTQSLSLGVRLRSQLVDKGGFTSDTGWGCMIRSGQCVLANTLALLRLGRDWRRGAQPEQERALVSLFADDPRSPFSLHRFVEHGASHCGKYPGEWFGPSATARCIKALTAAHCPDTLKVYMTGDGADVYEDAFLSLAHSSPSADADTSASSDPSAPFTPVLLLIGTRLGIDRVNPVYLTALQGLLRQPQSVGIAGGRPSASHYFVGAQGSHLFYLDPHQTRPALPASPSPDDVGSCHTRRLRRLAAEDMDPSMLIAFLIRDRADWDAWKAAVQAPADGAKRIVHLSSVEPPPHPPDDADTAAVADVEAFDEDEDEIDVESLPATNGTTTNGDAANRTAEPAQLDDEGDGELVNL